MAEGLVAAATAAAPPRGRGGTTSACRCIARTGRGAGREHHTCDRCWTPCIGFGPRVPTPHRQGVHVGPHHVPAPAATATMADGRARIAACCTRAPSGRAVRTCSTPQGGRLSGLRGLLAGRELTLFHPEGRPQSCPCAVGPRSRNCTLTVTVVWSFCPQEDHECLHQLVLPSIMRLWVWYRLQFAQRQGRGRRAPELRQLGLYNSNLSTDLIIGLLDRPTRCCALTGGLGRGALCGATPQRPRPASSARGFRKGPSSRVPHVVPPMP